RILARVDQRSGGLDLVPVARREIARGLEGDHVLARLGVVRNDARVAAGGRDELPGLDVAQAERIDGKLARLGSLTGLRVERQRARQRRRDARETAVVARVRARRI